MEMEDGEFVCAQTGDRLIDDEELYQITLIPIKLLKMCLTCLWFSIMPSKTKDIIE